MARAKSAPGQSAEPEADLPGPSVQVFAHCQPLTYPESRDACGRIIGRVEPGDVRVLAVAPDEKWRPASQKEAGAWIERADEDSLRQLGLEPPPVTETGPAGAGAATGPASDESDPDGPDASNTDA